MKIYEVRFFSYDCEGYFQRENKDKRRFFTNKEKAIEYGKENRSLWCFRARLHDKETFGYTVEEVDVIE